MSRYLLFGYANYYPSGGMNDVITQFSTIEEITEYFKVATNDDIGIGWNDEYQLVDTTDNFSYREYEINRFASDLDNVDILDMDKFLLDKLVEWIKNCIK